MKFINLILIFIAFITLSCETPTDSEIQIETKIATLIWTGDPATDGCGFFIEFDDTRYKPTNEKLIYESLETPYPTIVEIQFKNLNEKIDYSCGFSSPKEEKAIEVVTIKPITIRCGTTLTIIKTDKDYYALDSDTTINLEVINPFSTSVYYVCSGDIFLVELQNNIIHNSWKVHGFEECLAVKSIDSFEKAGFSIFLNNEFINLSNASFDEITDYRLKFLLYNNQDSLQLLSEELLYSEKFKIVK